MIDWDKLNIKFPPSLRSLRNLFNIDKFFLEAARRINLTFFLGSLRSQLLKRHNMIDWDKLRTFHATANPKKLQDFLDKVSANKNKAAKA
jgi:hypothetical protein